MSNNALNVENMGRKREREKITENHGKYKEGRYKSKGRMECWNCGKKGYKKKYYWSLKEKKGDGQ